VNPQTIDVPPLDLRADVGAINDAARTVELTFSTGADVMRYDWATGKRFWERLSMDPKHVRMGRLSSGAAPLLDSHSAYSIAHVIGVVDRADLDGKKGRATVRFSKRAEVEPFYQDVRDKIIQNNSIGYNVHRFEEIGQKSGVEIRLATDWEPYEISMVPMGADSGARTRSTKDVPLTPCVIVRAVLARTDDDRLRDYRLRVALQS
jgi:hypothetical protein